MTRPAICRECKFVRSGDPIDRRYERMKRGDPPPPIRGRLNNNYICVRHPITPAPIDPQTGFQGLPRGEDCRDLNPTGECTGFVRAGLLTRLFRP